MHSCPPAPFLTMSKLTNSIDNNTYKYKTYCCSPEDVRNTLEEYGVAIVPNVLDADECRQMIDGTWNYLEHITQTWSTPISKTDTSTWKQFYKLCPSHGMLMQHFGVGHCQAAWDVRQNPKVIDVYAQMYNCSPNELLASFDGMSFCLPPEVTNRGWARDNHSWYHTDQSYLTPQFHSVQSWVTAYDVNPGDATLTVFQGSHRFHGEFQAHFDITDKANWFKLTKEQEQFYLDKGCIKTHIVCPAGSMVLWDSRTIHCGANPSKLREFSNFRLVSYVCYKPRDHSDKKRLAKQIKKKQDAYWALRTTTHTPDNIKMFSLQPNCYNPANRPPPTTPIDYPTLTELGMCVGGL